MSTTKEEQAGVEEKAAELRLAARSGDTDAVESILAAYAGDQALRTALLSSTDDLSGNTALHLCSANGHGEIVKALLSSGAPADAKNKSGSTPLHYAALTGSLGVLKMLLILGHAEPCVENEFKKTAMDEALIGHHGDVVDFLRTFIDKYSKKQSKSNGSENGTVSGQNIIDTMDESSSK